MIKGSFRFNNELVSCKFKIRRVCSGSKLGEIVVYYREAHQFLYRKYIINNNELYIDLINEFSKMTDEEIIYLCNTAFHAYKIQHNAKCRFI